jgi:hypothetical protein
MLYITNDECKDKIKINRTDKIALFLFLDLVWAYDNIYLSIIWNL